MIYEKIQGKAIINAVSIPEAIAKSNEDNERIDIQISFTYSDVAGRDKELNEMLQGIDADLLALAEKAGRSNSFTYLLDATRLGYSADSNPDKVLKELQDKMEGKELVFTTYRVQVSELLKGTSYENGLKDDEIIKFTSIHNDRRAYSSFNSSYLLINDDAESVCNNMQTRILKGLENGTYIVGRVDNEEKYLTSYLRKRRKNEE